MSSRSSALSRSEDSPLSEQEEILSSRSNSPERVPSADAPKRRQRIVKADEGNIYVLLPDDYVAFDKKTKAILSTVPAPPGHPRRVFIPDGCRLALSLEPTFLYTNKVQRTSAPRKAHAYQFYITERSHADADAGCSLGRDAIKTYAREWRFMTSEQRAPYQAKADSTPPGGLTTAVSAYKRSRSTTGHAQSDVAQGPSENQLPTAKRPRTTTATPRKRTNGAGGSSPSAVEGISRKRGRSTAAAAEVGAAGSPLKSDDRVHSEAPVAAGAADVRSTPALVFPTTTTTAGDDQKPVERHLSSSQNHLERRSSRDQPDKDQKPDGENEFRDRDHDRKHRTDDRDRDRDRERGHRADDRDDRRERDRERDHHRSERSRDHSYRRGEDRDQRTREERHRTSRPSTEGLLRS